MDLINGKVTIEWDYNNPVSIYGRGEIEVDERMNWLKAMNDCKELDFYAADNKGNYYLIRDSIITNFSYGTNSNNEIVSSIEFRGKTLEKAIIALNFKDLKRVDVPYKYYIKYLNNNIVDNIKNITYEEFKNIIMVEEL